MLLRMRKFIKEVPLAHWIILGVLTFWFGLGIVITIAKDCDCAGNINPIYALECKCENER